MAARFVALALALALLVSLSGCGEGAPAPAPERPEPSRAPAAKKWRVYSSLPHAGDLRDVHLGTVLAFEEHAPLRVEHVALDSSRPDMEGHFWEVGTVQANARRAATDPRAMAYVGEIAAGASAISMPILGSAGIAQVAPAGTYTGLTRSEGAEDDEPARYRGEPGPHFVRVIPADHLQATATVRWMRELGTRRVMVVSDRDWYGRGMARMVAARARAAGMTVSEARFHPKRLATIRDLAERVRTLGADTVYYGGIWQNRGVALWGRVHRAAPRARLMGGDGLLERPFTEGILRSSRARTYITSVEAPPTKAFAKRFRARFGHAPHPLATYGYEAMRRALAGIADTAGSRRGVINALFARPDLDMNGDLRRGRFGAYRVGPDGDLRLERTLVVSGG